jgi:hypothetical protein
MVVAPSVLLASIVLPGCLATSVKLPPPDAEPLESVLGDFRPGQGGVFLWNPRDDNAHPVVASNVIDSLRATGVFTRVEDMRSDRYREYEPATAPVKADWVVTSRDQVYEDHDSRPEIPFGTLFTFGLIPTTVTTKVTEVFRLNHYRGDGTSTHELLVPGPQGEVIGLLSAGVVAIHPDWHMFGADAALQERSRDRLVKAILRVVLGR